MGDGCEQEAGRENREWFGFRHAGQLEGPGVELVLDASGNVGQEERPGSIGIDACETVEPGGRRSDGEKVCFRDGRDLSSVGCPGSSEALAGCGCENIPVEVDVPVGGIVGEPDGESGVVIAERLFGGTTKSVEED